MVDVNLQMNCDSTLTAAGIYTNTKHFMLVGVRQFVFNAFCHIFSGKSGEEPNMWKNDLLRCNALRGEDR